LSISEPGIGLPSSIAVQTDNTSVAATNIDEQPESIAQRLRPGIEAALERSVQFGDGCPPRLAEAIRYALLAPGKRLRPQLVLMAAEACEGPVEAAWPAACAVEMVHAYSLVHDDLPAMDDDDLRRGRPTCHKAFGEAIAILAGDALLARAFEVLATEIQPPEIAARCCAVLGRAAGATALVGGQTADLERTGALEAAAELAGDLLELESVHNRKTGALFVASLQLGALVAGATFEQESALIAYGQKLGLAFQITDDLLDVSGSQATVGKRVDKDAGRGKFTFPALLGIEASRRRAGQLADEACAKLDLFGTRAQPLHALARYVCSRQR
jgi:geranylgeranyl diphosphate synthase, type II